ncbi:hypothetical protein G4G27_15130 [Sphingomonas sp. So64.6b]|uniref:major capsid protein n=1 Tax=Sphingomonas sp. So64.6b TaxID=2997354 RepID=UPI0015FFB6EB|nr:hypothetical protein [Sphingomonas sp. So64.6b]QNA85181.1 hypothetical protein G4G27_15130 [Sphingomonas sp. So64.6b]
MATIGNSFLNLIDLYKGAGGTDAQTGEVIEVLRQLNPLMEDAVTAECNMGTSHRHTIRTGLPTVTWGMLYQGIPQSKSTTQQVDDTTGFVEGLSTVDTRLLDISPNPAAVRLSEGRAYLEAMAQEVQRGFFYHDTATTPEKFKGLATRYGKLGGGGAGNQIVDAGGTGSDNTSIWFVTHGDNYTTLIHPKGTKADITRDEKGEQRTSDANGNVYYVKEELFRQHIGVAVRDWRFNARIANVDYSDILAGTVDLYRFMRLAYYKLQGRRAAKMSGDVAAQGRTVLYMNRDVIAALDAIGTNSANGALMLKPMELQGQEVLSYRGIPIRETDALINAEARVV